MAGSFNVEARMEIALTALCYACARQRNRHRMGGVGQAGSADLLPTPTGGSCIQALRSLIFSPSNGACFALMTLVPFSQPQQPSQRLPSLEGRLGGAQEALRTFLLGAIDRWSQGLGLVHQLGVLPHTSIKNKFPYSK